MNKIRLLIVEDSMLMRDILKESILDSFPYIEIREVGAGDEAQKMLAKRTF